jgi:RNA polymerase sigma-70 factor (sigma-E family)
VRDELKREYAEYFQVRMPHLRRLAAMLCGDAHRGDDIVQSAATTLYMRWKHVRSAGNLDAYVRRAVVNAFLSEQRRPWARVALTDTLPDRPVDAELPADERLVVRAAVRRLPPKQQAVIVLRFVCDLPVAEVAELLDCAEGTVKSQTADGLAALRRYLSAPNREEAR